MTIPDAVTIQFDLLKMSMVLLETCGGLYRINKLCIKLVIETSLHYDAGSEKHQIIGVLCLNSLFVACVSLLHSSVLHSSVLHSSVPSSHQNSRL